MDCPNCGTKMSSGDSGEPDYFPGWWCDECQAFFFDDDPELDEDYEDEERSLDTGN